MTCPEGVPYVDTQQCFSLFRYRMDYITGMAAGTRASWGFVLFLVVALTIMAAVGDDVRRETKNTFLLLQYLLTL